jgi:hypothetical protein
MANVRRLYQLAAQQYAGMDGYTAHLVRHEQVNGRDMPQEELLFKFRKQPWSVYFQWVGKEGHGREAVYVKGQYEDKIQLRLAAGDIPLMPAGKRWSVAPDSAMATARSRHSITEAGLGSLVERFGRLVDGIDRRDPRLGTLTYRGPQTCPEFPAPLEGVEQVIPPGADAAMPQGGRRLWCFSPDNHLPVLVRTFDARNNPVEYYCYDSVQYPVALTDDDFNPDKLWPRR